MVIDFGGPIHLTLEHQTSGSFSLICGPIHLTPENQVSGSVIDWVGRFT
jgi:hypothetical protein